MSNQIQILWAGRHERDGWDDLCDSYRKRILHYVPLEEKVVRTRLMRDPKARQRAETEALERALPKSAWVVALDRRGRQMTSGGFSRRLQSLRSEWPHPVAFVLGSDLGLGNSFLERSRELLSLGRMTLPHNLARLVLYEQIYRALSITAGMKYHREPL